MSRPPKVVSNEEKKSSDEQVVSSTVPTEDSMEHEFFPPQHCLIASSQAETLLLSSSGDVLTSRCRLCPYPSGSVPGSMYHWHDDVVALCCDAADCDDLSTKVQSSRNLCAPWGNNLQKSRSGTVKNGNSNPHSTRSKGRLMGGAPAADVAPSLHHERHHDQLTTMNGGDDGHNDLPALKYVQDSESSLSSCTQNAFRTQPLDMDCTIAGFQAESILPVRSFDHSVYTSPPRRLEHGEKVQNISKTENIAQFVHGIPTFSSDFSNVKVKTISAHPLGSHVLLISNAGLLYSYGLNSFGQLGIGMQSDIRGAHRGYVMTPNIVTPLVENGGKAIACAAGQSHSLVVVETQERRLVKKSRFFKGLLNNHDEDAHSTEVVHHQVYGFGRNDYMKIGLVGPKVSHRRRTTTAAAGDGGRKTKQYTDDMECVVVPRRVALHASFHQSDTKNQSKCGIFAIAAGSQHSAALVRTQNGDVEMYSWGNSTHGALGLPAPPPPNQRQQRSQQIHRHHIVPVPTFVASLSHTPSNPDVIPQSLLTDGDYPATLSLSKTCSFVVTSRGRCFAFGSSEEGMLGLGRDVKETLQPTDILLSLEDQDECFVSVSAGACHVLATCASGAVYAWGAGRHAGLVETTTSSPEQKSTAESKSVTVPSPKPQQYFEWSPKRVIMPYECDPHHCRSGAPQPAPVVQATAGFDCSLFLSHSGCVYASGKNSGRLGLGELSEAVVVVPRPLFGGLHLWKRDDDRSYGSNGIEPLPRLVAPKMLSRKVLTRGLSMA